MPKDLTLQTTASGDTSRAPAQQGATPGPWTVIKVGYGANPARTRTVIFAENAKGDRHLAELTTQDTEANARLIAQSPALLAALKNAVAYLEQYGAGATCSEAKAAILAAEGSDRP